MKEFIKNSIGLLIKGWKQGENKALKNSLTLKRNR